MKSNGLPIGCWILLAMVVAAVVFVLASRGPGKSFFEGAYLRYVEHEFGREWDTLLIKRSGTDAYKITRKWKYERVLDGDTIAPEYKVFHRTAVWLENERLLVEEESGLRYRLEGESLQAGETVYQKLK